MKFYRMFDIEWDTDGKKVDLPSEVFISDEEEVLYSDDLVDELSDKYGFCVNSSSYEEIEHFIEA